MSGYRIVTPAGWDRIPLETERRTRAVERILDRQFRGIDDAPHVKAQLRAMLLDEAAKAAGTGAVEMYLSSLLAGPIPLESTLLVSVLPYGTEEGATLADLAAALRLSTADRQIESCDVAELPAGSAVRRVSLLHADAARVADETLDVPPSFVVEWYVPAPEAETLVLLTFTTMLVPIKDAFGELFDVVAATLQWLVPAVDGAPA